jgi:uncharacterized protein (TIGR03000 family)
MNGWLHSSVTWKLALSTCLLSAGVVQAQVSGDSGSSHSYPYWGTAPGNYPSSTSNIPEPRMPVPSISSATHSRSAFSGSSLSSSLGSSFLDGYASPFHSLGGAAPLLSGQEQAAQLYLRVPADAKVLFNGEETKQTGKVRHFYSPSLPPGKKFSYDIEVLWTKDGQPAKEKRHIEVHPGDRLQIDFTKPTARKDANTRASHVSHSSDAK